MQAGKSIYQKKNFWVLRGKEQLIRRWCLLKEATSVSKAGTEDAFFWVPARWVKKEKRCRCYFTGVNLVSFFPVSNNSCSQYARCNPKSEKRELGNEVPVEKK